MIIYSVGADRKQLTTAVAVEIAPSGPTRVLNLEANAELVKKSNNLLAPVTGEELYLSLGCGHTVAFCKVAALGGPTPQKGLQDSHGNIDYGKLCKQAELKAMLEQGWDWDIIPWEVDLMFPRFVKAVQKAPLILDGPYSSTILDFVKLYGGGQEAPHC